MQTAQAVEMTKPRSKLVLQKVPVEHAQAVIPHVLDRLTAIVNRSGDRYSVAALAHLIVSGEFQLWVIGNDAVKAVLLTELFFAPSGKKVASIRAATGDGAESWLHLLPELEAWAKSEGCHCIEAVARKGWARRLTDYKMTHVILEKELT